MDIDHKMQFDHEMSFSHWVTMNVLTSLYYKDINKMLLLRKCLFTTCKLHAWIITVSLFKHIKSCVRSACTVHN